MSEILFKIPLVAWIRGTIKVLDETRRDGVTDWNGAWSATYFTLGGKSAAVAQKGCPRSAAFALWRLGFIAGAGSPPEAVDVREVNRKYGKNAAYAVIAIGLLQGGQSSIAHDRLWDEVRRLFLSATGQSPAASEQGALKVASGLFHAGQISHHIRIGPV